MERVFIVADDLALATLMVLYLREAGFRVEAVHTGDQGVSRAAEWSPHLILLDLMLPGDRRLGGGSSSASPRTDRHRPRRDRA